MNKLITFVKDSSEEMRHKVSWPKYKDLQDSSMLVLVASMILALFIGMVDLSFENLMEWYYATF